MRMLSVSYLPEDCSSLVDVGAVEKTRTSTPVKEQRPQRCASTNSATTARSWSGGHSEIWPGCEVAI